MATDAPPVDPWKNRSQKMNCETCMHYVRKVTISGEVESLNVPIGRCRRHAPTIQGFPAVFETDWCGDHKIDEEKL